LQRVSGVFYAEFFALGPGADHGGEPGDVACERSANTELGLDASTGTAADSRTGTHGNTFAGRDEQFADGVSTGG